MIEGEASRVTDDAALARIADAYQAKYGPGWRFTRCLGALTAPMAGFAVDARRS